MFMIWGIEITLGDVLFLLSVLIIAIYILGWLHGHKDGYILGWLHGHKDGIEDQKQQDIHVPTLRRR